MLCQRQQCKYQICTYILDSSYILSLLELFPLDYNFYHPFKCSLRTERISDTNSWSMFSLMCPELAAIIKFPEASICRFLISLFARHRSSKFISALISITVSSLLLPFYCFIWVLMLVYIKGAAFLFYQKRSAFIAVICDPGYPTKHIVRLDRSIFYGFWSML